MSSMPGFENTAGHPNGAGGRRGRPFAKRAAVGIGLFALTTSALVGLGGPAGAVAPDFVATAGVYTVDTDALTFTGPGASFTGTATFGAATFSFNSVTIPSGATVNVHGSRTFTLVAAAGLTVGGLIDSSGVSASDDVAVANAGGAGGGAGGADGTHAGAGPGGGGAATGSSNGGGGGGFGGSGARGALVSGSLGTGGAAGSAYGNLDVALAGGSGGAGGNTGAQSVGGGGGGGAIALVGAAVTVTGSVHADGGGGALSNGGGSGGGSGGAVLIRGGTVNVTGTLSAIGGPGGLGFCCGDGGGGGGGRIAYQYQALLASGIALVTGGTSGTRATSGGVGPGTDHSLDPTGFVGVVTKTSAPDTAITGAKIRSAKHKATFRFAAASGVATSFECKLKKPHKAGTFKACTSPKTYKHLKHGRYKFSVRAIGLAGADLTPATKRFRIR